MIENTMPNTISCYFSIDKATEHDKRTEAEETISKILKFTQVRQNRSDYYIQMMPNFATFKRKEV
jgi:hypothetical protein